MKIIHLPWAAWYGDSVLKLPVPKSWIVKEIGYDRGNNLSQKDIIQQLNLPYLKKLIDDKKPSSIGIVIDDLTRPTPYKQVFELIIKFLIEKSYRSNQIHLFVAIGAHRPFNIIDLDKKVGRVVIENSTFHHHSTYFGNKRVGQTKDGVDIEINQSFLQTDFKIIIGTVLPHSSIGFSGGFKLVVPGLASYDTIKALHNLPENYHRTRDIQENKFHQRVRQAAKFVKIDYSAQIICNPNRTINQIFSTNLESSYIDAVKHVALMSQVNTTDDTDISFFNCYPLDVEFLQSGKSLDLMRDTDNRLVKEGGSIVICTASSEGAGYHQLRSPEMEKPFLGDWTEFYGNRELIYYSPNITKEMFPAETVNKVKIFQQWHLLIEYLSNKHKKPLVCIYQTASVNIPES